MECTFKEGEPSKEYVTKKVMEESRLPRFKKVENFAAKKEELIEGDKLREQKPQIFVSVSKNPKRAREA